MSGSPSKNNVVHERTFSSVVQLVGIPLIHMDRATNVVSRPISRLSAMQYLGTMYPGYTHHQKQRKGVDMIPMWMLIKLYRSDMQMKRKETKWIGSGMLHYRSISLSASTNNASHTLPLYGELVQRDSSGTTYRSCGWHENRPSRCRGKGERVIPVHHTMLMNHHHIHIRSVDDADAMSLLLFYLLSSYLFCNVGDDLHD